MTTNEFRLPDPGEGLVEAEIVTWRVAVGDEIKINDIVVEIETAKSLVELAQPVRRHGDRPARRRGPDGRRRGADPGDLRRRCRRPPPPVPTNPSPAPRWRSGTTSCRRATRPAATARVANLVGYGPRSTEARRRPRKGAPEHEPAPATATMPAVAPVTGNSLPAEPTAPTTEDAPFLGRGPAVLAKPPVRKLAQDRGVDLTTLAGSGPGGVITREDVDRASQPVPVPVPTPARPLARPVVPAAAVARQGDPARETRVPIKGVRKATADAMVRSAFTAPHVTEWVTCDVTATMELVDRLRERREFRGVKISPLLVVAKAVCVALSRVPQLNAYWDEAAQEIATLHYVNLGIAAATPRGLVVPNLKDADAMTLLEMAQAINNVVSTARDGRTSPSDMAGGTFTITNVGTFGVDAGTPIVNPGEAGILCVGQIARRPWVVGAGRDERIEPRWVTTLAVSFDHRLVDGEQGSVFLSTVAQILTDPGLGLLF